MDNLTDEELIQLFHEPDSKEKAFNEIINKYKERLYWHIRRLVIVHEDADDILQNVFIKVWNGLSQFRKESQLYTWLYRIGSNECFTFIEKEKKRLRASNIDVASFENKIKDDPHFDGKKIEWKLQQAIQQLPEQQRAVFTLRYFDEMPYKEMSDVLNVSEGALKASYHHAVKKIENFLTNC